MTRKDYVLIANAIRASQSYAAHPDCNGSMALGYASAEIANMLERDNPRFDRAKFLEACSAAGATS